ncbi:MAG: hypothetical protein P8Y71_16220 [Pseudolabrys sp.]
MRTGEGAIDGEAHYQRLSLRATEDECATHSLRPPSRLPDLVAVFTMTPGRRYRE